jgi:hypothetical protein
VEAGAVLAPLLAAVDAPGGAAGVTGEPVGQRRRPGAGAAAAAGRAVVAVVVDLEVTELVGGVALDGAEDAAEAGRPGGREQHDDDRNDGEEAAHPPVIGRPPEVP